MSGSASWMSARTRASALPRQSPNALSSSIFPSRAADVFEEAAVFIRDSWLCSGVLGGVDCAESTAWRTHCPGGEHESGDDERGDDVESVGAVAAAQRIGCGSACEVEEDAGI